MQSFAYLQNRPLRGQPRVGWRGTFRLHLFQVQFSHLWVFGLAVVLSFPVATVNVARCQDDPFGSSDPFGDDASNDFGAPAGAESDFGLAFDDPIQPDRNRPSSPAGDSDPLDRDLDPLIFILQETPPQTPKEFGQVIFWMTQLGHWKETLDLLDQVATKKWGLPQKADLARSAGANTWIKLRREKERLNEQQLSLVNSIFEAPSTLARSPEVIDRWIDQLSDPEPTLRRTAQLRLQDGDSAAIERLLNRLLEGDPKVAGLMLAGTIVEFGKDGIAALQAACTLRDAAVSSRVILAIAELPSNYFPFELAAGLHSDQYTSETKKLLAERIKRRGLRLPNRMHTATHLSRAFDDALTNYQTLRVTPSPLESVIWGLSDDGMRVVKREGSNDLKALERLFQIALHRASLAESPTSDQAAFAAVGLQRAYHLDPRQQSPQWTSLVTELVPENDISRSDFWIEVFRQTSSWEMHGGSVLALNLMAQRIQAGQIAAPLEFLSSLLVDPRPIIRYHALETLASVDPKEDYAGSERALATAVEMLQLGMGPAALVIGANAELCMAAEASIRQITNGEVIVVTSGRESLRALSLPNPAELIFVVDRVHDMSLFELLQRLRKTQGGGSLPIAVLTDQINSFEQKLMDETPGLIQSLLSRDSAAMQSVIRRMMDSLDTQPISSNDRQGFARSAETFLATIAEDRELYSFYPFDTWHESLVGIPTTASNAARSQVLASLGTGQSQIRLVQLVAASGATEAERTTAARAFAESIRKFGNLLSSQDIQTTYDLYNRLGPNDPAIAKFMAYVLDVIEAQAGTRDWPADL